MDDIEYFKYDKTAVFSGVITKLAKTYEIIPKSLINCSASSVYNIGNVDEICDNVFYNNSKRSFTTNADEHASITIGFPSRKILLKQYTLTTTDVSGNKDNFPICWKVRASDNNATWRTIDERNTTIFTTHNQTEMFQVRRPMASRYIQIMQTCLNSVKQSNLRVRRIDFYGTFFADKYSLNDFCLVQKHYSMRCKSLRGFFHLLALFYSC